MKNTKLFVVLNEETLNTMKGKSGWTAKFETKEEANMAAAEKLNMWVVVKVAFEHKYLQHRIEEKCTCGCGTDIIIVDNMVFSDHTSKWMKKADWDKMYKPNKENERTRTNELD